MEKGRNFHSGLRVAHVHGILITLERLRGSIILQDLDIQASTKYVVDKA